MGGKHSRDRSSNPFRYSERLAHRGVLQDGGAEEEPASECEETDPLSGLGGLGALGCILGAGAVIFRWQSVDPPPQRSVGACSAPATCARLATRPLCACALQAEPLGVKGAGVLRSRIVLEPEGDVAPRSGPSGARIRLIINSPGCVRRVVSLALCEPPHGRELRSSIRR